MPVGYNANLTKQVVDSMIGKVTQDCNLAFIHIKSTKEFFDIHVDSEFEALGYTTGEVATMKSAMADLDELRLIYEGVNNLTAAKNFRAFADECWGTGFNGQ